MMRHLIRTYALGQVKELSKRSIVLLEHLVLDNFCDLSFTHVVLVTRYDVVDHNSQLLIIILLSYLE